MRRHGTKGHTTRLLTGAILFAATFGAVVPAHPFAVANNRQWDARLVPAKTTIVQGEPIFVSYVVRNVSGRKMQVLTGRPDTFHLTAARTDGFKVSPPRLPEPLVICCSYTSWYQEVKPHASYSTEQFLPDMLPLSQPGTYALTCRHTLDVSPETGPATTHAVSECVPVSTRATTTLTVLPPDAVRLGQIIARLGQTATAGPVNMERLQSPGSQHWQEADRAARLLCAISDARAVPWLVKLAHQRDMTRKTMPLTALARFNSREAFEAIVLVINTRASDICDTPPTNCQGEEMEAQGVRLEAVNALVTCCYAGALPYLWTLVHDKNPDVRLAVVQAAIACPNRRTTAILQSVKLQDLSPFMRDEVRRALKARHAD